MQDRAWNYSTILSDSGDETIFDISTENMAATATRTDVYYILCTCSTNLQATFSLITDNNGFHNLVEIGIMETNKYVDNMDKCLVDQTQVESLNLGTIQIMKI